MASPATTTLRICNHSCGFSAMQSCNSLFSGTADPSTSSCSNLSGKKRARSDSTCSTATSATTNSDISLSKRTTPMADESTVDKCILEHSNSKSILPIVGDTIDNPVDFLKTLFSQNETTRAWMEQQQKRNQDYAFSKPSPEELANYDLAVVKAVRERNLTRVQSMLQEGHKFDACNRFGESLIHMACRRGDRDMVAFLLDDARVNPDVCDDFGRRPLHDALWTSQPSLDVVGFLLKKVPPSMFLAEDVRGHTPFHYARREHWPSWVAFLRENAHILLHRVSSMSAIQLVEEVQEKKPVKSDTA